MTGFKVHKPAQRLFTINAVTAVSFLALGGVMALLIALTRWQDVHLLQSAEMFYRLLSAHGATMLVFWIVFFEIAGLHFAGTVLLNTRLIAPKLAWFTYGLMAVGAIAAEYYMLTGQATVMFTAYPPLEAHPNFYLGVILFAVGALVACSHFIANVVAAKMRGNITGSVPLVVYAFLTAAILAVFTLLSGAMAFVPLWLASIGLLHGVDPAMYRLLYWGFGHGAQQVNLAAMIGCWYALASLTVGARPVNEGISRIAFLLYILFIQLGSIHHLLVDPGLGTSNRIMNTSYFMYLATLASLIHAFSIPAAVESAQRRNGFTKGLFGWLRNAPWKEPGFSALVISFTLFGFLAGVTGVLMGTMQLNMLIHNTLFVPGHFHQTVVIGTTISFMGLAYYVVPLVTKRQLVGKRLASWQPYIYAFGLLLLTLGMQLGGKQGLPRRVWDISYANARIPTDIFNTPTVDFALAALGIGAIIAVAGGGIFVGVMVATVFFGKRVDNPVRGLRVFSPQGGLVGSDELESVAQVSATKEDSPKKAGKHADEHVASPGTLVLIYTFLAWFILWYGVAFVNLSKVWPVG